MQEATDWLMGRFKGYAAITITYSRGGLPLATVSATVGRTPFDILDGGVIIAYESRDYLIDKADLVDSGGAQVTPATGDLITETNGRVYVVSMPGKMNVYENIGPGGTVFKVHTKGI
jgi:hypothetical protein